MSKYQNSKIYKLVSPHTDEIYIGSTVQRLCSRLSGHKRAFRKEKIKTNKKLFELGDVKIILIEEFPCDNKEQLLKRERHHIENNVCLNYCIPGRTYQEIKDIVKERNKIWLEKNKDKYAKYKSEYNKIHKHKANEKIACECGCFISRGSIARHKKTKKHQSYLSNK